MACRTVCWVALLMMLAAPRPEASDPPKADAVVARVYEHVGSSAGPLVRVVDSGNFPAGFWNRVHRLVAFRIHRHLADGSTQTDPLVYLVRTSGVYIKADAALRNHTTKDEYVWCLLSAVIAHEAAHTGLLTERQALMAETAQLRRCLFAGHLHSGDGWNAVSYLGKVEAKLRNPQEHY